MEMILKKSIQKCLYCRQGRVLYYKEVDNKKKYRNEKYKCGVCGFVLIPVYSEMKTKDQ